MTKTTDTIRVLVVDDSFFMRTVLTDLLGSSPEILILGTAKDGLDAVEKTLALKPDVVTMDLDMPGMDGLEALRRIMTKFPTPVVVVSAYATEGAEATLRALELGAVDFVLKPKVHGSVHLAPDRNELINKVIAANGANTRGLESLSSDDGKHNQWESSDSLGNGDILIAIGASAGGPRALVEIFKALPASLESPLVIIQHMPQGFTESFAERLDSVGKVSVRQAQDGDFLSPGTALVAPGGKHMAICREGVASKIQIKNQNVVPGAKPSIDLFMQSTVGGFGGDVLAVVLTGMGRDGTEGAREVHEAGGRVLAQDEATSLVYGMPKAVVESGHVKRQVPIQSMARAILSEVEQMDGGDN